MPNKLTYYVVTFDYILYISLSWDKDRVDIHVFIIPQYVTTLMCMAQYCIYFEHNTEQKIPTACTNNIIIINRLTMIHCAVCANGNPVLITAIDLRSQ